MRIINKNGNRTIVVGRGETLSIINGKTYLNGEAINLDDNVRKVHTSYGDIDIKGDVDGDVHTNMGDIECGNVDGDVHTNMGSIRYRKD